MFSLFASLRHCLQSLLFQYSDRAGSWTGSCGMPVNRGSDRACIAALRYNFKSRGVAQSGSASALGAEGRGFESLRPDHSKGVKSKTPVSWRPAVGEFGGVVWSCWQVQQFYSCSLRFVFSRGYIARKLSATIGPPKPAKSDRQLCFYHPRNERMAQVVPPAAYLCNGSATGPGGLQPAIGAPGSCS